VCHIVLGRGVQIFVDLADTALFASITRRQAHWLQEEGGIGQEGLFKPCKCHRSSQLLVILLLVYVSNFILYLPQILIWLSYLPSQLEPIQFIKDRCLKPIAHCESRVLSSFKSLPQPIVNPGSTAHASTSRFTSQDPQVLDVAMEDADKWDCDIRGVNLLIVFYMALTSRSKSSSTSLATQPWASPKNCWRHYTCWWRHQHLRYFL
jgi:hypothetical protein